MLSASDLPLDVQLIRSGTNSDPTLRSVHKYLMTTWPNIATINQSVRMFYTVRKSLSTEDGCIFYGNRIVIPEKYRNDILKSLHNSHTGSTRMKMVGRSYVYWPHIDKDIENFVNQCEVCQLTQNNPKEDLKTHWPSCNFPFQRVHLDFFHFAAKSFLILTDSYSKYIDVKLMPRTTAHNVIVWKQSL